MSKIVKTGDFLERNNEIYEVVVSDCNIFVICKNKYDEKEKSFVTNYNNPEIYANQSEINKLKDLNFKKINEKIKDELKVKMEEKYPLNFLFDSNKDEYNIGDTVYFYEYKNAATVNAKRTLVKGTIFSIEYKSLLTEEGIFTERMVLGVKYKNYLGDNSVKMFNPEDNLFV